MYLSQFLQLWAVMPGAKQILAGNCGLTVSGDSAANARQTQSLEGL